MAYTRLRWVESETPLSAQNMNNIEDGIEELKAQKVDKVSGKGLSDQNYTATEKTKLAGIAEGAEVNVQPDWNQTNTSADDFIKNKPVDATTSMAGFMSAADKSKLNGIAAGAQVNRTYTAVTGKPAAAASPGFGGTVTVSQVAQDANGQVSVTDRVIMIPSSDATTSAHGLMTAADKSKLNGIAAGAQVNPGVATTSANGLMSADDKTKLNGISAGADKNRTITIFTYKLSSNVTIAPGNYAMLEFSGGSLDSYIYRMVTEIRLLDTSSGNPYASICQFYFSNSSTFVVWVYNCGSDTITLSSSKSYVKINAIKTIA